MKITPIALALALTCSFSPAYGQDWLAPLQELADQLTGPAKASPPPKDSGGTARPAAPRAPTPPVVARPDIAPVAPPSPLARPDFSAAEPAAETAPEETEAESAPEPEAEAAAERAASARVYQGACPAVLQGLVAATMRAPIAEGACGEQSPLEVTAVLSRGRLVPLSSPVTTNCAMASALPAWVAQVDGYAQAMLESPLAQINTGPGYMCRKRNNAETGFVSEHGFANALDVNGFTLQDGRVLAVKTGWLPGNAAEGRLLRLAHDAACGSFTTVLGPEANADHEDHIHLDLGCHGQSCTAQLCE
ncbi:extensin family protein [Devosia sp.]|uniref:extensin-like domain-containing protein n=1 Tax=Devosia sp. TaxID=1871048 RepID=UPI002735910C|nr:extensin family protein [Devosia sp.]MDP2780752.1 extensin family protein [Devosia sp.]